MIDSIAHRWRSYLQGLIFNEMRSKTKTIEKALGMDPSEYPDWSYDGSSTGQASGNNSDCILK
jgi:glutamine synthetase